jgi:phosphoenolpyruvate carboxylase
MSNGTVNHFGVSRFADEMQNAQDILRDVDSIGEASSIISGSVDLMEIPIEASDDVKAFLTSWWAERQTEKAFAQSGMLV